MFGCLGVVAQFTGITHPHIVAFAAFHCLGNRGSADRGFDVTLYFSDAQPMPGNGRAVYFQLDIGFAYNSIGKNGCVFYPFYLAQ